MTVQQTLILPVQQSSAALETLESRLANDTCKRLVWEILDAFPPTKGDYRLLYRYARAEQMRRFDNNPELAKLTGFEKERLLYSPDTLGRRYREICDDWCRASLGMSYEDVRMNSVVWRDALKMPRCPLPLPRTIAKRDLNEGAWRRHEGFKAAEKEQNADGNVYVGGSA